MSAEQDTNSQNLATNGRRAASGVSQWELVEQEHKAVVAALNDDPVTFTVRSAEGITLYGGIESHSENGKVRELAEAGHRALVERVHMEKREQEKRREKQDPRDAGVPPS